MPKGIIALVGVLVVGLAASWSPGQKLAEERKPAKARGALAAKLAAAAKAELERFLAKSVPQARSVGVGSVLAAKTSPALLGRVGVAEKPVVVPGIQELEVRLGAMLYGPRPEGEKVSLSMQARGGRLRAFKKGDKVIFSWGKTPRHGPAAVRWSKQAEQAVLLALAPGWERGKCFRCPWCRKKGWVEGKGKCGLCGGRTASGAFKLCAKCATPAGRCQMCKRTVGPATGGAKIRLTSRDPRAKAKALPAGMAEARFELGERIRLWVSAGVAGKVAVAELPCPGGKELGGCETLYFIVNAPGRREAVLFPILPLRRAKAELEPKPLTNSTAKDRMFAVRMVLDDKKKVFERPGRYAVRAAAGRLASNPVTVVVKEHKPAVPVPRPGPRPAWLDEVVPQITPDGRGVQAVRGGKMLWKMKCSFVIGAIEQKDGLLVVTSEDGKTVVTIDLATGEMISKRVAR